jgi:hypothetical protein
MRRPLPFLPFFLAASVNATAAPAAAQGPSGRIRLDQIGFYPGAPKVAVVEGSVPAGGSSSPRPRWRTPSSRAG